jgi:hypothetical protein
LGCFLEPLKEGGQSMGAYPDVGAGSYFPLVSRWYLPSKVVTFFRLPTPDSISLLAPSEILFSSGVLTVPEKTPIPDSDLLLSRALVLEMETTRDGVVLRSEFVDEESYGATLEEAYFDFLTSLKDRLVSLERREPLLSVGDREILERLRLILKPSPK